MCNFTFLQSVRGGLRPRGSFLRPLSEGDGAGLERRWGSRGKEAPRHARSLPSLRSGSRTLRKRAGETSAPKAALGRPPAPGRGGGGVGSSVLGEDTEAGNGGACARKRKPSASCRGRNDLGLWGHARGDKPQGHCP